MATELIVALDYPKAEQALELVQAVRSQKLDVIWKVGSELFMASGPEFVRKLTQGGGRVFLDLKFHDIPNTVTKAAAQACELGVAMFTLHIAGGSDMVEAVMKEVQKAAKPPIVLGVTVLTSFDESGWKKTAEAVSGQRPQGLISDSVSRLAAAGAHWGLTGIVCSAHEIGRVQKAAPDLYTVVPGIRPAGSNAQDQARILTPAEAAQQGASAIVVGRPITQAAKPVEAIASILKELASA